MAPLIIKGFLPQQNGSSIMLPAEITTIAGSDFDIDKMFLFLPSFKVYKYDIAAAKKDYERIVKDADKLLKGIFAINNAEEQYDSLVGGDVNKDEFKKWFDKNKEKYKYDRPIIKKVKYDLNKALSDEDYLEKLSKEARDNMIMDISYGILTSPQTASNVLHPGNFDKLNIMSNLAAIINDERMYKAFTESRGYKDFTQAVEGILEIIKNENLDMLEDFIKNYKTPKNSLLPQTFEYFHNQNMTGAALIGMYANNTTMQAKFQYTDLSVSDKFTFTINGRPIRSLHDDISERGELISENCAQFSAASVDNVKKPVLANLMQNLKTANIGGTLARLGLGCDEIGLLFMQPSIRHLVTTTGQLSIKDIGNTSESTGLLGLMSAELNKLGGTLVEEDKVRIHDFTSKELLKACIIGNFYNDLSVKDKIEYLRSQINVLTLFKQCIIPISEDLGELTRICRADSPNGAIKSSLAGALLQQHRLKRLMNKRGDRNFTLWNLGGVLDGEANINMSRKELNNLFSKSKMPMLQAFYSLGIDLAIPLMQKENFFPQVTPYALNMINEILDNAPDGVFRGSRGERLLNAFFNEMTIFGLTSTDFLGSDANMTLEEKRDYYLYDFPSAFIEAILSNPEVMQLSAIKKLSVINGEIVMLKSGRMTPISKEMMRNSFDQLLYLDGEITMNGEKYPVQKLAIDLFMYSFYKEGLRFGPNSFGNFFSTQFMTAFPKFIEKLRFMGDEINESTYFNKYLEQFIANHFKECVPRFSPNQKDIDNGNFTERDGNLYIKSSLVNNPNGHITSSDGVKMKGSYERLIYNSKLYKITEATKGNTGFVTYVPAPMNLLDELRYNAKDTAFKVMEYQSDSKKVEKAKSINSNSIMADNMNLDVEKLQLPDDFELNDDFMDFMDFMNSREDDSIKLSREQQEDYSPNEGQQVLDDPMCEK